MTLLRVQLNSAEQVYMHDGGWLTDCMAYS